MGSEALMWELESHTFGSRIDFRADLYSMSALITTFENIHLLTLTQDWGSRRPRQLRSALGLSKMLFKHCWDRWW